MSLSSGLTIDCSSQKCSGGVAKLYLANKDDVDAITYTTDDMQLRKLSMVSFHVISSLYVTLSKNCKMVAAVGSLESLKH